MDDIFKDKVFEQLESGKNESELHHINGNIKIWYYGKFSLKWDNIDTADAWENINRKYRKSRIRRIRSIQIGVAASIAILFCMFLLFNVNKQEPILAQRVAVPTLITSDGLEIKLTEITTFDDRGITIINSKNQMIYHSRDSFTSLAYNELILPKGGEYTLKCADGTTVYLNSESSLRFPLQFTGETREVYLTGEAYFDVAKNENTPFIVHLSTNANIEVLGTSFNIMSYEEDANIEITLVSGKVKVSSEDDSIEMIPNQQVVLNKFSNVMTTEIVKADIFTSWKEGTFIYDKLKLDELMKRLNRWFDIEFEFEDENMKSLEFSGSYYKYDSLEYILELLTRVSDVRFKIIDKKVYIRYK